MELNCCGAKHRWHAEEAKELHMGGASKGNAAAFVSLMHGPDEKAAYFEI
jgi:hypothetical protein